MLIHAYCRCAVASILHIHFQAYGYIATWALNNIITLNNYCLKSHQRTSGHMFVHTGDCVWRPPKGTGINSLWRQVGFIQRGFTVCGRFDIAYSPGNVIYNRWPLCRGGLYSKYHWVCMKLAVQWSLSIKDTLVPANLSTVERLSTPQRWRCISTIEKSTFGALGRVLCREGNFYGVL